MKVTELEGPLLDYWVARAEGKDAMLDESFVMIRPSYWVFNPSRAWALGGPILQREEIQLRVGMTGKWYALGYKYDRDEEIEGRTPLEAAMRCFVASRFGNEVEFD